MDSGPIIVYRFQALVTTYIHLEQVAKCELGLPLDGAPDDTRDLVPVPRLE